ncbi:probable serine/threonine-protein kinase DDB_G0282963, partial [Poecilia formosa]|uniref:probable serine/threonine-protein kinase DDB_G0282963 n=1 Tax=Poecilia formosa TaxID=48698 RepID=UPI0007B821DD
MCIIATIQATQSGISVTQLYKACAASSLCPATGTSTFSVNLGSQSAIASAQCCNTDNCNSQTLPAPSPQPTKSLQCLVCDPTTSQCTTPIICSGDETNCFSAILNDGTNTIPALGCASPNTCTAASGLGSLPFMQSVGSITSGPTCCTTSLCNVPSATITTTALKTTTAAPTTTTTAPTTTTARSTNNHNCNTNNHNFSTNNHNCSINNNSNSHHHKCTTNDHNFSTNHHTNHNNRCNNHHNCCTNHHNC